MSDPFVFSMDLCFMVIWQYAVDAKQLFVVKAVRLQLFQMLGALVLRNGHFYGLDWPFFDLGSGLKRWFFRGRFNIFLLLIGNDELWHQINVLIFGRFDMSDNRWAFARKEIHVWVLSDELVNARSRSWYVSFVILLEFFNLLESRQVPDNGLIILTVAWVIHFWIKAVFN